MMDQKSAEEQAVQGDLERVIDLEREVILDSISEHVIYQDREHRILWSNRAANESVGETREALKGRYCYEVWPQRTDRCPDCPVAEAMETGEPHETEKQTPDGRSWIVRGYPVRNDEGDIIGGIEVTEEVTERRRAEGDLLESRTQMQTLLEAIPDLMFRLDREGVFIDFHAGRGELALPPEAFLGQKIEDVLPPHVAQLTMENIEKVLSSGQLANYEYQLPTMEEQTLHDYEVRMVVSGEDEVLAIVRDVTERKEAERALQHRAEFDDLVANISTEFVNVPPHRVDDEIHNALETIGEFAEADRSYLFLFSDDGAVMTNTHEWCAEGVPAYIDDLQDIPSETFPWLMERFRRLESVLVPRVADLPDEAQVEREEFEREGIQSIILVPATYQGELVGFLGLDAVEQEKAWTQDDAVLLRLVGETFVNALERKRAQRRIQRSLAVRAQQVELTTEIAQDIAGAPALEDLYERVVTLVKERLGYYHVQIFRYDEALHAMRVVEGYGDIGAKMKAAGHHLPYGEGVVGTAAATGEPVLAPDVTTDPNWRPYPDLPDTEGELAVPIKLRDEVLGVLDVQSDEAGALTEEDQVMLLGLAGQIASAVESTNLLAEVQESQRFLDTIIDNIPNPIFYQDDEGVYLGCNEAFLEYLGMPDGEVKGKTVYDITPDPEMADMYHQMDQELLDDPGTETYEASIKYADGSMRDVVFYKTTFNNPDGSVGGLIGTFLDITERKEMEQALRESEERYRSYIDNAPDGIFIANEKGEYIEVNDAACRITGYSRDELVGKKIAELQPPDKVEEAVAVFREIVRTGRASTESSFIRKDGELRYWSVDAVKLSDTRFLGFTKDITERKEMEQALRESEERYRSYIDNAPDGIFISDEEGRYLEVNDAACRITGYDREELLGMHITDLLPPESMDAAGKHFQELTRTGKATGDFKFLRKDGSEGYWTVDAVKLSDTRFLGFAKDITDRVRTQQMLTERVKELNCLSDVGQRISETPPIPDLLRWVVVRIPPAMQYPEICVTAIEFEGQLYGRPEALDLPCHVVSALRVSGETVGHLYVAYEEERDFLDEESAMLGGIVRRIENYVERRRASRQLEKRAQQLAAVAEVAGSTSTILDPDELVQRTVELVRDRFDLYYVGLFMVDETGEWTDEPGEWAVLRTGTGEAGRQMLEDEHKLKINGDSMIGWCIANQEPRIALDVGEEAARFENPYLAETRSELALPIVARGDVIGALSIQSTEAEAFSEEDITVFQTMVDQVATAIENARLFEQTQEALARTESLYEGSGQVTRAQEIDEILEILIQSTALRRLDRANFLLFDRPFLPGEHPDAFTVEAVWEREGGEPRAPVGTRYDFEQFPAARVVDRRDPTIVSDVVTDERIDENTRELILTRLGSRGITFWPLVVGEQWIGLVTGQASEALDLNEGEIRQITSLVDQAAAVIQNIRLLEQTEARARREETLREITDRVRGLTDPDAIVRAAVRELGTALGRPTFARLGSAQELAQPPASDDGGDGKEADD